jgi:hypothetical protein
VPKVRSLFAAVFFACAGAPAVSAESEPTWEDFQAVDNIGTTWAYSAFLQQYPSSDYADLARERMLGLTGRPVADLSNARTAVIGVPSLPATPSERVGVGEPNYGDAFFIKPMQR